MVTLVIEDGTGIANANAYIDISYVTDYADSFSDFDWAALATDDQNKAIVNATRFIDIRYRTRLPAAKLTTDQALQFPRSDFTNQNGVIVDAGTLPTALKDATAAAALHYAENGNLNIQTNLDNSIRSKSCSVGGAVSESVEYFYPKADNDYIEIDAIMGVLTAPLSTRQFYVNRG